MQVLYEKSIPVIRATRAELGNGYEVKYGCIIALQSNPSLESENFFNALSLKKFAEFGKNHPSYNSIVELTDTVENESTFKESLENMLSKPISVLQLLATWQKEKLNKAGIIKLEDLDDHTETDLIEKIYNVGPVRARLIKNAANAELLEYLSG